MRERARNRHQGPTGAISKGAGQAVYPGIDQGQKIGRIGLDGISPVHGGSAGDSADRKRGRSVVVMAADHETVDHLAMRARAAGVRASEVETGGITLAHQTVGVGDEIVTTQNDPRLITTTGAWVRNGDRWKIDQGIPSGSLRLRSLDGRGSVTVPGSYGQEHVALAYAVTVHKGPGVTCDQALLVVDRATSVEHL